jgi:hypothetical protein
MQGIHKKERKNRKRKTLLTHTGLLMEGVSQLTHALSGQVKSAWQTKVSRRRDIDKQERLLI